MKFFRFELDETFSLNSASFYMLDIHTDSSHCTTTFAGQHGDSPGEIVHVKPDMSKASLLKNLQVCGFT